MAISAQLNTRRFNESGIIASVPASDASPIEKFRIEARNRHGALLAYLNEWNAGSYSQALNSPGQLSFTYPALTSKAAHLVFPNQVWLYDHRNRLIDKFHILPVKQEQSSTRYTIQVDCESLLYQLSKESITSYYAIGKSVKDILKDWLNDWQMSSRPIRIGTLERAIANQIVSINVQGKSILAAIEELFTLVNRGVYYVDSSRRFIWKNRMRNYAGQQIRVGKNLQGIKIQQDTSRLVNRIYVYGHDSGPNGRYSLLDSGELHEYKQDSTSVSTYGVHAATKVLKNVREPSTLEQYADAVLDTYSQPFLTYEVDVADLEQVNPLLTHERIQLGSIVRVINEDLDIATKETIVSIERDLNSPANVKVTLANKLPDITDHYTDLIERITELENTPVHDLADAEDEDDYPSAIGEDEDLDGPTSVGTSTKAARADHTHLLSDTVATWDTLNDSGTLPEMLTDILSANTPDAEAFQDALSSYVGDTFSEEEILEAVSDNLATNTTPTPIVSTAGSVGTSEEYMRADATIQGMPWRVASDKTALASAMDNNGELGYTTGTNKRGYWLIDGELVCVTHLEA